MSKKRGNKKYKDFNEDFDNETPTSIVENKSKTGKKNKKGKTDDWSDDDSETSELNFSLL